MKRSILFPGLLCTALLAHAQEPRPIDPFTDSSRYILLTQIQLSGTTPSMQQKLVGYFRANPNAGLEEIMSRLPEVSFGRRGPYGMEPVVRGYSGGQVNLLIDGMRIYGACTDKMDPPTIYLEPTNLDELRVQTTRSGFLHGSAIGGSVLMKTADPRFSNQRTLRGTAASGYQSATQGWYNAAKLNYGSDRFAAVASATYRKNQNYRAGGGETISFSQMEKVNYSLSAKYRLNPGFSLRGDFLGDEGWNIGYPALPMDVGRASAYIGSITLVAEKPFHGWQGAQLKAYANTIKHAMDDTHRPNVPMHMDMPGWSKTAGLLAQGDRNLGQWGRLHLVADLSSTFLKAEMTMYPPNEAPMYMLTWPDHRKTQGGLGLSWNYRIDSNWSLQANGRIDLITHRLLSNEGKQEVAILGYDTDPRTDLLKNLSVTTNRKIGHGQQWFLGLSYAERVPTGSELYGFYLFNAQDGYDYLGNADLNRETVLQAETGLRGKLTTSNPELASLSYQLSIFAARMGNYITGLIDPSLSAMTIGAHGVKTYVNLPYATRAGAEMGLNASLRNAWQATATLRYTWAADDQGAPLPMIPPFKSILSLRYQPGAFSVQGEWEAAARQDRYSMAAGENATDGFMLLHLRMGYAFRWAQRTLGLQAGVENIFDTKYHEHLDWNDIPRPGRNIYVQLNFQW